MINRWPLAIGGGHDINRLRYARQLDIDNSNIYSEGNRAMKHIFGEILIFCGFSSVNLTNLEFYGKICQIFNIKKIEIKSSLFGDDW